MTDRGDTTKTKAGQQTHRNPLEHIRSTPLSDASRDMLLTSLAVMGDPFDFPSTGCLARVFSGLKDTCLDTVSRIAGCTSYAVGFLSLADLGRLSHEDDTAVRGAFRICMVEAQRQMSTQFALHNPFWKQFYARYDASLRHDMDTDIALPNPGQPGDMYKYKRRYALYLLPLDALHHLSERRHQLEYEILQQSLTMMVLAFVQQQRLPQEGSIDQFKRALNLVRRLHLGCYDQWISDHLEYSLTTKTAGS